LIEREAAQRNSARIKQRRLAIHAEIETLSHEGEARDAALQYVQMARTTGIGALVLGMPTEDKRKYFRAAFKSITLDGCSRGRWRQRSVKSYELSDPPNTFILQHASGYIRKPYIRRRDRQSHRTPQVGAPRAYAAETALIGTQRDSTTNAAAIWDITPTSRRPKLS